MNRITLNQGEILAILATAKTDGSPITLDDTWDLAAAMEPAKGGTRVDLAVAIQDGKAMIHHDTVAMAIDDWLLDIRFTNPSGTDQWSEIIAVKIKRPITPPSAR